MADPISQQIMEAVDIALKTIWRTDGYNTDLGNRVYEWRKAPVNIEDAECVIYRDMAPSITRSVGEDIYELPVEFILIGQNDNIPKIARSMYADIVKCLFANETWGGLAERTVILPPEDVEYIHHEHTFAGIRFRAIIDFRTTQGDPYTQA